MNKEYTIIGSYRGMEDAIAVLEGNKNITTFHDEVNGGDNNWRVQGNIDEIVKLGVDLGVWEVNEDQLIEVGDCEEWDDFYKALLKYEDLDFDDEDEDEDDDY